MFVPLEEMVGGLVADCLQTAALRWSLSYLSDLEDQLGQAGWDGVFLSFYELHSSV